jgi:hypothetical protein
VFAAWRGKERRGLEPVVSRKDQSRVRIG